MQWPAVAGAPLNYADFFSWTERPDEVSVDVYNEIDEFSRQFTTSSLASSATPRLHVLRKAFRR
jgi:hypothetical protein